jgi:hypothetical protein
VACPRAEPLWPPTEFDRTPLAPARAHTVDIKTRPNQTELTPTYNSTGGQSKVMLQLINLGLNYRRRRQGSDNACEKRCHIYIIIAANVGSISLILLLQFIYEAPLFSVDGSLYVF